MPISDSLWKALAPSARRFTLANLFLGPISVKFQNWTYAQDTVLFLYNESFWRIFNIVCMGLWTGVATAVPCPPLVEVALGGHNPLTFRPCRWSEREKQLDPPEAGALFRLDAAFARSCPLDTQPQKYCARPWGSGLTESFFFLLNFSKMLWVVSIHLQSFHFYFFMNIFSYTFDSHLASSCFSI